MLPYMATNLENYRSVSQAARELRISAERVRQLIRSRRLPALLTPYGALLHPADLETLRAEVGSPGTELEFAL